MRLCIYAFGDGYWSLKPPYEERGRPLWGAGPLSDVQCQSGKLPNPSTWQQSIWKGSKKNTKKRHALTKSSSIECHCSRSIATTCQEPLGKPTVLKKYSSNASDHLLQGCPRLRRPSGTHDNNCDDHLPSVLRAKCPAHLQCLRLTAATQSSKPALWRCSSAKCVVRRIQSIQSSWLVLASFSISSGSVLMSQDEDDELSLSKVVITALLGVAGINLLPAPKIHLSMRRCVVLMRFSRPAVSVQVPEPYRKVGVTTAENNFNRAAMQTCLPQSSAFQRKNFFQAFSNRESISLSCRLPRHKRRPR